LRLTIRWWLFVLKRKIMKQECKLWFNPSIFLSIILTFTISCNKKDNNGNSNNPTGTVTDIDGNLYHTVTVGTQVWMVENLRVTHYRNGDSIPNIKDSLYWSGLISGAYCDYNNVSVNSTVFGHLYNWYATSDPRNVAPIGWHVPTIKDWHILFYCLGCDTTTWTNVTIAGAKMKEAGTLHWTGPNTGATNSSGFTALPGGCRNRTEFNPTYGFFDAGTYGTWWTSNERIIGLSSRNNIIAGGDYYFYDTGFSIRCIKD